MFALVKNRWAWGNSERKKRRMSEIILHMWIMKNHFVDVSTVLYHSSNWHSTDSVWLLIHCTWHAIFFSVLRQKINYAFSICFSYRLTLPPCCCARPGIYRLSHLWTLPQRQKREKQAEKQTGLEVSSHAHLI